MGKYRRIAATYVFPITSEPIKNGMLVVDADGVVVDVVDRGDNFSETEGVEHYTGILCPGFVNAHCHLELSHLKGQIEQGQGLADFLSQIFQLRNTDESTALKFMKQADLLMRQCGIVAVGDVSNSLLSLEIKEQSQLYYHTFIEVFGFHPQRAPRTMEYAEFLSHLYNASKQSCSITPHAPYSTSAELFDSVIEHNQKKRSTYSLHHQETEAEDQLFITGDGSLLDHYKNNLNIDTQHWQPTHKSSTQSVIGKIPYSEKLLLVHNTYLNSTDANWLKDNRSGNNTFLVTCPKSNLYIEKRLPDYNLWNELGFPICVGTDSLASNTSLSVLEEIKIIAKHYEQYDLSELLIWSTLNGAKALGIEQWAGSFELGKKPGANLLTGINFDTMKPTERAGVKKLV